MEKFNEFSNIRPKLSLKPENEDIFFTFFTLIRKTNISTFNKTIDARFVTKKS